MSSSTRIERRRLLLAGTVAATTAVAGCGSATRDAGTRRVPSARGAVAVPQRARRIACLDLSKIQRMLDVGVRPVAAPDGWEPLSSSSAWYADVPRTGTQAAIDVEQVAKARPDLILGTPIGVRDTLYEQLSRLAPTVLLQAPGAGSRWKQLSAADARAAGRSSAMKAVQARYSARVADLRSRLSARLAVTTWGLAYGVPGAAYAFSPAAGMAEVLLDLGVRLSRANTTATGVAATLSYEQLGRLDDADVILTDAHVDGSLTATTQALLDQATFRALPAARSNQVHSLSHLLVFSYGEALALLDQVEAVADRLPG